MIRRQLPVYSPISLRSLIGAAVPARAPWKPDPRAALARLLQDRYSADQVALTGSGTQALTLAIRTATRAHPGPLALPAFTCYDVATAAVGADAPAVLYDIDPDTLGPDWASLEAALEAGARTVVVAYLYGIPVDWDRVADLAERYDATVIEDAAQGVGGSWRDRPLGSLGPMSILSFGRGKGWTGGRGGALLLRGERTPDPAARPTGASPPSPTAAAEIGTLVTLAAQWLLARPSVYGLPYGMPWLHLGETRYREPEPVRGITRAAAAHAFGTAEMVELESDRRRRRVAEDLEPVLSGAPACRLPSPTNHGTAGYLRLACRVVDPSIRGRLLARTSDAGVAPSYPEPLGRLVALRGRLESDEAKPGAETLARELVTLPTHSRLAPRDLVRLQAAVRGRTE